MPYHLFVCIRVIPQFSAINTPSGDKSEVIIIKRTKISIVLLHLRDSVFIRKRFEIIMLIVFGLIWCYMILVKGLPVLSPDGPSIVFLIDHYLSPLIYALILQFLVIVVWKKEMESFWIPFLYLPLISIALFLHFNFKSWVPLVNSNLYDPFYMSIDNALSGIVFWSQNAISHIPGAAYFYHKIFVIMFCLSFAIHLAFDSLPNFRKVVAGVCFILLFGGVSYWFFPAVGPFIYQNTLPDFFNVQQKMYDLYLIVYMYHYIPAGYFISPLAAMPSLHVAHSFFLTFMAMRSVKPLGFFYIPLFLFLCITAVASRWHYIIDLPFGLLLSFLAIWLVDWLYSCPANVSINSQENLTA